MENDYVITQQYRCILMNRNNAGMLMNINLCIFIQGLQYKTVDMEKINRYYIRLIPLNCNSCIKE